MKARVFGGKMLIVWFCLAAAGARAQVAGGSGPAGMSSALSKLFGKNTAFSAKGEMQVTDNSKREVSFWPMDFSLLNKKIRVEIDLAQTRNKGVPAQMGGMLKQMGMSQVVSIIRPDKGLVYVIYPDQQAMFSMALPKEDSEGSEKAPKITKTPLGKETVDGHPCTKNNVVITDSAGQSTEAITWDASDLQGTRSDPNPGSWNDVGGSIQTDPIFPASGRFLRAAEWFYQVRQCRRSEAQRHEENSRRREQKIAGRVRRRYPSVLHATRESFAKAGSRSKLGHANH
jgi:hypothetical protein